MIPDCFGKQGCCLVLGKWGDLKPGWDVCLFPLTYEKWNSCWQGHLPQLAVPPSLELGVTKAFAYRDQQLDF